MTEHISQIQKLLALSRSDNPNEAAVALKKAHALMDKYGYKDTDIQTYDKEWEKNLYSWISIFNLGEKGLILMKELQKIYHPPQKVSSTSNAITDDTFWYDYGFIEGVKNALSEIYEDYANVIDEMDEKNRREKIETMYNPEKPMTADDSKVTWNVFNQSYNKVYELLD